MPPMMMMMNYNSNYWTAQSKPKYYFDVQLSLLYVIQNQRVGFQESCGLLDLQAIRRELDGDWLMCG